MENLRLQNHSKGTAGGLGVLQKDMIASYQEHFLPHTTHTGGAAEYLHGDPYNDYLVGPNMEGGKRKKTKSKKRSRRVTKKTVKSLIKNSFIKGGLTKKKRSRKSRKSPRRA